jgi:hypothetical protein
MKPVCLILVGALLAGCGTPITTTPQAASANTTITVDPYTKTTKAQGDWLGIGKAHGNVSVRSFTIDGKTTYQIYLLHWRTYSQSWAFLDRAYDIAGTKLDTMVIGREVPRQHSNPTIEEHIGINVSREYLESTPIEGRAIKVIGTHGEVPFTLPKWYIEGFLAAVDKGT